MNRRHFLKTTLATGLPFAIATSCRSTHLNVDPDKLKKLGASLKGQIILPTDTTYETARRVFYWNQRTERYPALIVQAAQTDDVRRAIEFARAHSLEIAVRGGGHSYSSWGTTNGLLLDLSQLNEITIDPTRRVARIGAGALSGQVARACAPHNLAPVLGQCPDVGAVGVTLGGGLGWLSGTHRASCDNLLSADLITADSQLLPITPSTTPDLFWALQGAGPNFGVTTSFDTQLHPIGLVTAGEIHYPTREARTILRFFRETMSQAPDNFQATLNLTPGERGIFISLCHTGSESEANQFLRPFHSIATPTQTTIKRQDFATLSQAAPATKPTNSTALLSRHIQTVYRDQLTDEVFEKMLDSLAQAPADGILGISHYMHGEVCCVAPEATPFSLRQPNGAQLRASVTWQDPSTAEPLMRWVDNFQRQLRPTTNERIYANFQSYQTKDTPKYVFASNLPRLTALKKKHDPTNLFHRNSNINPTH